MKGDQHEYVEGKEMDADPLELWGMYRPGMEREHVPVSPCSHFIFQGLKIS